MHELTLLEHVALSPEELARLEQRAVCDCPACGGHMTVGADEHAGVCDKCIDAAYAQLGEDEGLGY